MSIKNSWKDECGVFGIWNHPESAKLTYLGLYAMQHRGQESAGIVTLDHDPVGHTPVHRIHKALGLVSDVFNETNLAKLAGHAGIGHVRYSTTGDNLVVNAQPLASNLLSGPVAIAHNGNIVNASILREALQRDGAIFQATSDTEILLHLLAKNPSNHLVSALFESLKNLSGAYSFTILAHDRLIAARDPFGFRPLVLGQIKTATGLSYVVASETCALDLISAQFVREIEPGEILEITSEGFKSYKFEAENKGKRKSAHCVFEHML
jgi:amidophosphoribosyltransferase